MANGSSRFLPGLIALVVGFAIGWLVHRAPVESRADDQLIRVHADGSVSKPQARLGRGNTAAWISDGGATLEILFPEKHFPNGVKEPPFVGMTHRGTDWAVRCGAGTCFAGNLNPNLPQNQELRYKYDQVVGDKRTDGMIIINP